MRENARATAVTLLMRTFGTGGYSNLLLDRELSKSGLSPEDKRLCTMLYYGVTERFLTLRYTVGQLTDGRRLDREVFFILCLGLYQMKWCDGIPARAAVDESVRLCGFFRKKSASGFVNAVLRRFQREGMAIPVPDDALAAQEVRWSAPAALIAKITAQKGEAFAEQFFESSLLPPPTAIRLNDLRAQAADIADLHPEPGGVEGAWLVQGNVTRTEQFRRGLFHVQDTASQLCCAILDPQPGETVLDVCAAPGGKSFTIAERMQDTGIVLASDLHPHRVQLITQGAARLGLTCIRADVQDAAVPRADRPQADRVLCDVPCSGLGVIRRKPEIKYKPLESFAELPALQYRILETSAGYVKPGGVLVYSTCTVLAEENEEVVARFLAAHPDFHPVPLTELGIAEGQMTFSPAFRSCDGFFAARLRREV